MIAHVVCHLAAAAALGCTPQSPPEEHLSTALPAPAPCSMAEASPWIRRWFAAWELTARETLRLEEAPAPEIVLFDGSCIYTTSAVTAGGAAPVDGPALLGEALPWRSLPHDASVTMTSRG